MIDTGVGIKDEVMQTLFKLFDRATNVGAEVLTNSGIGLGLSISK